MNIKKNSWVQIKKIILNPHERASNIPEETKSVPLLMWVKGFLTEDAYLNDEVTVKTITGRLESGTLIKSNPSYMHTYGQFMPEIIAIDQMLKQVLYGDDSHE